MADAEPRPARTLWSVRALTPYFFLALLAAATSLTVWRVIHVDRPEPDLPAPVIEPSDIDMTDHAYPEFERIERKFRIGNPLGRPIVVTAIQTSCACMATVGEGGSEPPFTIPPNQGVNCLIRANPYAGDDPVRTYSCSVVSECDGRPLPVASVRLHVTVEDLLKAEPTSLALVCPGSEKSAVGSVLLYTKSRRATIPEPRIEQPDLPNIEAKLTAWQGGAEPLPSYVTRFKVDVTVTPGDSLAEPVIGTVSVLRRDGEPLRIPVLCSFRLPYRLSPEAVEIAGNPGEQVEREVFYNALDPAWRELRTTSLPGNVSLDLEGFDPNTTVLKMRIRVPEGSTAPREGPHQNIRLSTADGQHAIQIPIRYSVPE